MASTEPPRKARPSHNVRSSITPDRTDTSTPEAAYILPPSVDGVVIVSEAGDVVLRIAHEGPSAQYTASIRADSAALRSKSKYFERLLQPARFGEGADVDKAHAVLRERYRGGMSEVPLAELPVIAVEDVGRISAVKSIEPLLTDLFMILHGRDIQAAPPVANLANLAIVADRFDALDVVRSYVGAKKLVRTTDVKTTSRTDQGLSEEKVRQRLLVALLLDYSPWVEKYSARVITKGWTAECEDLSAALWWDLPMRVEEEMAYRRDRILETLQSLQSHFLALYTSRERQCRLGYDSSAQCDSFQLGEMVRFFTRLGLLHLQGSIAAGSQTITGYEGDAFTLLDTLRQAPEYQIDRNHSHCGLRTRLMPLLDFLQEALQHVGICPDCWNGDRRTYAWMDAKRAQHWKWQNMRFGVHEHATRHANIRAIFTAEERAWTS